MQIPGVIGVGYGYKQRRGVTTQEPSLRVYVREKKPRSALPPSAIVPDEINGLKTDVIERLPAKLLSCEVVNSFEPVVGGITIGNLKAVLQHGTGLTPSSIGTLGALGTLGDVPPRDNIGILTNNHVLAVDGGAVGDNIYNPQMTPIGNGNYQIKQSGLHPIGEIHDLGMQGQYNYTYAGNGETQNSYYLDCACGKLSTNYSSWCHTNVGTGFDIRVNGLGVGSPASDNLEGIARITEDDIQPGQDYVVYKVGRTTGKTQGKVVDTHASLPVGSPPVTANFVIEIESTGPNCEGGAAFSDQGDSGSVIVNRDRKVIGLLFAGSPTATPSTTVAAHIHPVLDRLRMTLLSTQNNPATAGTSTLARIPAHIEAGPEVADAAALRQQILATERGRLYRALAGRHLPEIQALVNRTRPVTVVWHRLRGPDFAAHVLHASRHAHHAVPRAIQGQSRSAAFTELLAAFHQHGSAGLREDIAHHADELGRVLDGADDLETLAHALRSR